MSPRHAAIALALAASACRGGRLFGRGSSPPPALLAPLSTCAVSPRPLLRWTRAIDAATAVEICGDRRCTDVRVRFDVRGSEAVVPRALAPGVYYWRLHSGSHLGKAWSFVVRRNAGTARARAAGPDLDGDGFAEVLIGATHADREAGRLYVFRGGRAGPTSAPPLRIDEPARDFGAHFGWSVAAAGDLDGDGFGDAIAGAPDADGGAGRAYVFYGSPTGPSAARHGVLAPHDPHASFGSTVLGAGDLDGDGFGDVVVSAPNALNGRGRVYVYRGSARGLGMQPVAILRGPADEGGAFGTALASLGEQQGGGIGFAVGAPMTELTRGRVHLFAGIPAGRDPAPRRTIAPPAQSSAGQFGATLADAGDLDGDGRDDLLVGAPTGTEGGTVYFYPGRAGGLAEVPVRSWVGPDGAGGSFGWSLAGPGDLDGDGTDDAAIGAVCAPYGWDPAGYPTCGAGRVYLLQGARSGPRLRTEAPWTGPPGEPAAFGWTLAAAGDVDGDGWSDVLVGANAVANASGAAYLFRGAAPAPSRTPWRSFPGRDGDGGNFGWSVAARTLAHQPRGS